MGVIKRIRDRGRHLVKRSIVRAFVIKLHAEGELSKEDLAEAMEGRALTSINSMVDSVFIRERQGAVVGALGDGELLARIWAKRMEILEFILLIIRQFSQQRAKTAKRRR